MSTLEFAWRPGGFGSPIRTLLPGEFLRRFGCPDYNSAAINSRRVTNHILLILFDDFLVTIRMLCGRSTRCFTVPALQRASYLPRKQNQNRTDMVWQLEAVNRSSNCNPGRQI